MEQQLDKLSTAVSLTVLEIDFLPQKLIPAFLLANLMSPALWAWRNEKSAVADNGILYSPKNRLNQIQRFFHHYTFTNIDGEPGGDPWGLLDFTKEEERLGKVFVHNIREEYDATFRKLLVETPDSQFGQIINQPYYRNGFFPRLKNETLEVMNAFMSVNEEGKSSGKCIGLGMLWAAALVVWGRFPLDRIVITGNRAHMFVYLDVDEGHLLNNTKWFSTTRINNQSELSEFARVVASSTETTFFYNPSVGMCHCTSRVSQIPHHQVADIYSDISKFVSNPLKHPDPDQIQYIQPENAIPDPLGYESAEDYQAAIVGLADEFPDSIYEYALYAFRRLDVKHPQVYVRAALRDYNVRQLGRGITELSDALSIVAGVAGRNSIFGSRDRIAMPDETLYFNTGSDREKALLLYTLLRHSPISDAASVIGLAEDNSFVSYQDRWMDLENLSLLSAQPSNLRISFNDDIANILRGEN
jgi:hypothetical protein